MARSASPVTVAALAATVTGALVVRDPHGDGSWGSCPVQSLTGGYCPGCGSLRALHDLATGDVAAAVGHNPLTVVAIGWLSWAWLAWAARTHGGYVRPAPSGRVFCVVLLATLAAFTIARNVPGSVLAP